MKQMAAYLRHKGLRRGFKLSEFGPGRGKQGSILGSGACKMMAPRMHGLCKHGVADAKCCSSSPHECFSKWRALFAWHSNGHQKDTNHILGAHFENPIGIPKNIQLCGFPTTPAMAAFSREPRLCSSGRLGQSLPCGTRRGPGHYPDAREAAIPAPWPKRFVETWGVSLAWATRVHGPFAARRTLEDGQCTWVRATHGHTLKTVDVTRGAYVAPCLPWAAFGTAGSGWFQPLTPRRSSSLCLS